MARNKYGAVKTVVDGITFPSKLEARRYGELKILELAGEITDLELQPEYELQPRFKFEKRTIRPITYRADFRYTVVATGEVKVEDTKGVATEAFNLKKKMMLYVHGIKVILVRDERKRRRRR